jgi:hypothetical protein
MKPASYLKNTPSRDASRRRFGQSAAMQMAEPIPDCSSGPELTGDRTAAAHPAFTDSTWDEIIGILESEALAKFAIGER